MSDLFPLLEEKGITDGPSAQEVIKKLKPTEVFELLGDCFLATNSSHSPDWQSTVFTFTVNTPLAGGIYPCIDVACRIENAYRLALFGSLYSDVLLLPNLFDWFYDLIQSEHDPFKDNELMATFYRRLIGDITVYYQYKPLIDVGLARINHTLRTICKDCQRREKLRESKFRKKIDMITVRLENEVLSKIRFVLEDKDYIRISDPENFAGGDTGIMLNGRRIKSLAPYINKAPYEFNTKEIRQLGLINRVMDPAINDLLEHNYYQERNATYLTDRPLDIEIIEKAREIEKVASPIAPNNLYHSLPYLDDILIEDLVKLRQQEGDSFEVYRDAITLAIKEGSKNPREIVDEVINPAVNKVQSVITNNKQYFRRKAGKKIAVNVASATIGFTAAHMFNVTNLPVVASASFGTSKIIDDLINSGTIPQEARINQFYYLWKAKKVSGHA